MILDKSYSIFEPQFPHLSSQNNIIHLATQKLLKLLVLNKTLHANQFLTPRRWQALSNFGNLIWLYLIQHPNSLALSFPNLELSNCVLLEVFIFSPKWVRDLSTKWKKQGLKEWYYLVSSFRFPAETQIVAFSSIQFIFIGPLPILGILLVTVNGTSMNRTQALSQDNVWFVRELANFIQRRLWSTSLKR